MGALMDIQGCSNTMTSAMSIVKPLAPQRGPGKAIQGQTRSAFWENGLVYGYMTLQCKGSPSDLIDSDFLISAYF